MGRVTSVIEDPNSLNYQTSYQYDALNDLTNVTQGSSQTRTYTYDMLGRPASAQTPEAATTHYCYTTSSSACATPDTGTTLCSGDSSEVCRRTDARSITTTYAYDALNRLQSRSYSDGTPTANYSYGQSSVTIGSWGENPTYPLGRLTEATTTVSGSVKTAVVYSYDKMGRVVGFWQCNPATCGTSAYALTYTYDGAGDVSQWSHPGLINFTNSVNAAQQVTAVTTTSSYPNLPQTLAQNIAYTAWGAVSSLQNGCSGSGCSNAQETYTYNKQLQPSMIQLSGTSNGGYCLVYNYYADESNPTSCAAPTQGKQDNGNVIGYWYQDTVQTGFSHSASYGYDGVNRLNAACTLSGSQCATSGSNVYNLAFGYDQFGNMNCTGRVGGGSAIGYCPAAWAYNASTNQLASSTGCTYDAAGNLTKDCSTLSNHAYQWDAEGRVSKVDPSNNPPTWTFTYNALGQRVQWVSSSGTFEHMFDPSGHWLGIYGVLDVMPRGAGAYAYYTGTDTYFNHTNVIASTSIYTNHAGTPVEDVLFYPWGQLWQSWGSGGYSFAGMPYYDTTTETSLTLFRHYSSGLGRWLSPDPAGGDITNPQLLNRYAYVMNNPMTLVDPFGLDSQIPGEPPPCTPGQQPPRRDLVCGPGKDNEHAWHERPCSDMECVDQYYGGEAFFGDITLMQAVCSTNGIIGFCGSSLLQTLTSPTGSDEFDINAPPINLAQNGQPPDLVFPGAGLDWSSPPGSMGFGPNGGPAVSTGSLSFSDLAWSEVGGTYGSSNVLELPPAASQESIDVNNAEIKYLMNGTYLWSPNPASAASSTPGATAFGPVPPPPYPWPGFPGWWFAGQ